MKRSLISALLVTTLSTCGASAPATAEGSAYPEVTPVICTQETNRTFEEFEDGSKKEVVYSETRMASQVRIGSAQVTASHVKRACGDLLDVEMDRPEWDIAIIQAADTGECRNAELGEKLVFVGFPGKNLETGRHRTPDTITKEVEIGEVTRLDAGRVQLAGIPIEFAGVVMEGRVNNARSGYSGGAVYSIRDDRIVGIISSHSIDELYGYFIPIESVCQLNNEALAARTE